MAWYQFRDIQQGEFFIVFGDTSEGASDYCAVQFLSAKWLDIPIVYHAKVPASYMTPLIHDKLNSVSLATGIQPIVAFERNNGGGYEMDRLERLNREQLYRIYTMKDIDPTGKLVDTGKLGWNTNAATRPRMLNGLKDALEGRLIHLYHRQTVNELFSFIVKSSGRAEAEKNAHDDLVMSLAGAWQLYQTEKAQSERGGGVVETIHQGSMYKEAGILYAGEEYA
jgi:hypothetical protein